MRNGFYSLTCALRRVKATSVSVLGIAAGCERTGSQIKISEEKHFLLEDQGQQLDLGEQQNRHVLLADILNELGDAKNPDAYSSERLQSWAAISETAAGRVGGGGRLV